jgi:hypothetical protein
MNYNLIYGISQTIIFTFVVKITKQNIITDELMNARHRSLPSLDASIKVANLVPTPLKLEHFFVRSEFFCRQRTIMEENSTKWQILNFNVQLQMSFTKESGSAGKQRRV